MKIKNDRRASVKEKNVVHARRKIFIIYIKAFCLVREYENENVMSFTENNGDSNVNEIHLLSSRDKISLTLI